MAEIAAQYDIPGKAVEVAALEHDIIPERYVRNLKTLTIDEQITLLKSTATIVGLGGLGGTMTELLARLGVGTLFLVDDDRFEDHNLNRQLFSEERLLNLWKADAAKARVKQINSSVTVHSFRESVDPENAATFIRESDVAVDCLDNIETRFILEAAAKKKAIPMVSAAVGGICGHVTTIYPQDRGLELIYGPENRLQQSKGAETVLGCLPHGVSVVASLESAEVVKVLLNQPHTLRNRLMLIDLSDNSFDVLDLR